MPEIGGDGFEELADRLAQSSEWQAANARILLEEIERRRGEAREQGRNFSAPTGAQVLDRLRSARSPMFSFLAWDSATSSPGTISLSVGVFNPDPVQQSLLFVHVFIGPATLAADVGQALELVDERFPRLTEPEVFGLTLDPSASGSLDYSIAVPANIEPSNYVGNAFLFQASLFTSASPTFDRAFFGFKVS